MGNPSVKVDCFQGFSWCVPKAFRTAITACRFEEGDRLYPTERAYLPWNPVGNGFPHGIMVVSPKRSFSGSDRGEDSASTFERNWYSNAIVNLENYHSKTTRKIETTQGRIFTCLWKGNVDVLDHAGTHPEMPLLVPKLKPFLPDFAPIFRNQFPSHSLFLMALDQASDVMLVKRNAVAAALQNFELTMSFVSVEETDISERERFIPTAGVACFAASNGGFEELKDAIKSVVYRPTPGRISEQDQFRIEAHGLFLEKV